MMGRESKRACEEDQMLFTEFDLWTVHSPLMLDLTLVDFNPDFYRKGHVRGEN